MNWNKQNGVSGYLMVMGGNDAAAVDEEFLEQVKQALDHLYDFPYLQRLPLAFQMSAHTEQPPSELAAGQMLRRELMHAIESLRPDNDAIFRSPEGRLYNLVNLYYVSRMTIKEVSIELGISERQTYRDLKRGQASIAEVLWSKTSIVSSEGETLDVSSVESELSRLRGFIQSIDLVELVTTCLNAVEPLAAARDIALTIVLPEDPVRVSTNAPIAQQVVTKLLSHSIKKARSGTMVVDLRNQALPTSLVIIYNATPGAELDENGVTSQLLRQLNWRCSRSEQQAQTQITLELVADEVDLLVVDDNEGIGELLARYLSGHNCRVVSATASDQGLDLALKTKPDVILLDVMMPGMDGWELLQRLKSYPETAAIPVVVCSVLHDPELAVSLGASGVITKPVTQERILGILRSLNIL